MDAALGRRGDTARRAHPHHDGDRNAKFRFLARRQTIRIFQGRSRSPTCVEFLSSRAGARRGTTPNRLRLNNRTSAPSTSPPTRNALLFSSDRLGKPDLWLLSLEHGTLQALADDPTPDVEPRFSPDGSWIAFASYRTGKRAIWIVPSTGDRRSWSPKWTWTSGNPAGRRTGSFWRSTRSTSGWFRCAGALPGS